MNTVRQYTTELFSSDQCQQLDRHCTHELGMQGYALMQQAAQAAFAVLLSEWPNVSELIILCGKGNNGGDGFEIACLAKEHGLDVQLVFDGNISELTAEAKQASESAKAAGLWAIPSAQVNWQKPSCVIVDALLGTGTQGAPRGLMVPLIEHANESGLPILSVDVPSGLNATTGSCAGIAICAQITVTMLLHKQGLFTGEAREHTGEVRLARLGVPNGARDQFQPTSYLVNWHSIKGSSLFQSRQAASHKGHFGHVLLIGGDLGMAGAISLAASAALRGGAGLVSVATRPEHIGVVVGRQPEVMAHGVVSGSQLGPLIDKADVIAIGPGLGQNSWSQQMLQQVMQSEKPVVLDADALNLIAQCKIQTNLDKRISVMTPHPGEAARLLGLTASDIAHDRFRSVKQLSERFHSHVVLKGAGSLIGEGEQVSICTDGNPGMASGGMGDVLTGVLAASMAQHYEVLDNRLHQIVCGAVCLHSASADEAAKQGETSLLASDLLVELRQLLN